MPREDVEYRWESLKNPFVPGYTLKRYMNRKRSRILYTGWEGTLIVQQDINRERWLFGISMQRGLGQHIERVKESGHAATLDEAKTKAEQLLSLLSPQVRVKQRLEQEDADAFG